MLPHLIITAIDTLALFFAAVCVAWWWKAVRD
jgi:hypothetical protein